MLVNLKRCSNPKEEREFRLIISWIMAFHLVNYQVWIWTIDIMLTRVVITGLSAPSSLTNPHSYWMKAIGYSIKARVSQAKRRSRFIAGLTPDKLLHKLNRPQIYHWTISEVLSIRDAEVARLRRTAKFKKWSWWINLNSQPTNFRNLSKSKMRQINFHHYHRLLLLLQLRNRMKLR